MAAHHLSAAIFILNSAVQWPQKGPARQNATNRTAPLQGDVVLPESKPQISLTGFLAVERAAARMAVVRFSCGYAALCLLCPFVAQSGRGV